MIATMRERPNTKPLGYRFRASDGLEELIQGREAVRRTRLMAHGSGRKQRSLMWEMPQHRVPVKGDRGPYSRSDVPRNMLHGW
jgi:hypothetical protein